MDLAGLARFGFLVLPNYSMIATANAIEACRMANRVIGRKDYVWRVFSTTGAPVAASNGLSLAPVEPVSASGLDLVFVCGGVDVRHAVDAHLAAALRRLARSGLALGALCTGAFALAEAGLLAGYRCAVHWEDFAAIREEFPDTEFVADLFAIDRDRITCTGGIAPLDLMASLIAARHGSEVAARVSAQFLLERIRTGAEPQHDRMLPTGRAAHPALARALVLIESHIETPLSIAAVARRAGVSTRQLERLFWRQVGCAPAAFAASLRLDRAQRLLRQTAMPVTAVGLACGFASPAHFSASYRARFGYSPRTERVRPSAE